MKNIGLLLVLLSIISCGNKEIKAITELKEISDPAIIHYAIEGDLEKVKECMMNGANRNLWEDNILEIVLMYASGEGQLDIVKYLVKNGVDVNAYNDYKYTALMCASGDGNLVVVNI